MHFSVQLLSEEYSAMSPGTLEAHGLINTTEYAKVVALTRSASPDAHKKIAGQLGRKRRRKEQWLGSGVRRRRGFSLIGYFRFSNCKYEFRFTNLLCMYVYNILHAAC